MIARLLRHLLAIGISVALVMGVTTHLGTSLAARSMGGYTAAFDAAQSGDSARASSIVSSMREDWLGFSASFSDAWGSLERSVESSIERFAPGR